jgi:hypothetical protein
MALRMLLVGVVACLGLNQPRLHATSAESGGPLAGVAVLGLTVESSPIVVGAEPTPEMPVLSDGPTLARGLAWDGLLDWRAALGARDEALATLARRRALAEALERARTEPRVFTCLASSENRATETRIVEIEEVDARLEVASEPAPDPDNGFRSVLDEMLLAFEADANSSLAAIEPPPAAEAEAAEALVEAASATLPEPEPLYPGLAYDLNHDHDGIDDPSPLPRPAVASPEPSETRGQRVATAVRLTGEALQAWAKIFVQTGPIRR